MKYIGRLLTLIRSNIVIRIPSTTICLVIASILASCVQPTTTTSSISPVPTIAVTAPSTSTLANTPTNTSVSNTQIVGPANGIIEFAGHTWNVKSGCGIGPGPNCWSDSAESVWIQDGALYLKIRKIEDRWYSAEVTTMECTQYGAHRFFVSTKI
jgi:hypothetical protein